MNKLIEKLNSLATLAIFLLVLPMFVVAEEEVFVYGKAIGQGETRANVQIDQAVLEDLPLGTGVTQMLERVSGIQAGSSDALGGGGFGTTITMRGFGQDSIGFSIDGIPNGRTALGGGAHPNRFADSANMAGIEVAQSAGSIGSPSRQALVGHVNFLTKDPKDTAGMEANFLTGDYDTSNYYVRVDSGEIFDDTLAYISSSYQNWDVWTSEGTGDNYRLHFDAKLVKEFDGGAVVKVRNSYNDRSSVGYNIVNYEPSICHESPETCFVSSSNPNQPQAWLVAFTENPDTDGYLNEWTGIPFLDQNYRTTRGNEREDNLTYITAELPLKNSITLDARAYLHLQKGLGRFAHTGDHRSTPDNDAAGLTYIPGTVGYNNTTGFVNEVDYLYFRNNRYEMERYGALFELNGEHSDLVNWTAGLWYEDYHRTQIRNWHHFLDQSTGPEINNQSFHVSEDKGWDNRVIMFYVGNQSIFFDERLTLEYGISYMDSELDYAAPVHESRKSEYNYSGKVSLDSGILPRVGATYVITDSVELFAGYAENAATIADGTLEDLATPDGSPPDPAAEAIDMDRSDVIDVGLRYTTDNFAFGVQGFHIESSETISTDFNNSNIAINIPSAKKVQGIEVTFNGGYGPFEAYISATQQSHKYDLDPRIIDADGNLTSGEGFLRSGSPLIGIPDRSMFAELSWKPKENIKLSVTMRYSDSRVGFYSNPNTDDGFGTGLYSPDEIIPGFTVFGLNISYRQEFNSNYIESVKLNLNIENLTDKDYLSGVATQLIAADTKFAGRYFIGAPRSIFLTAAVAF